MHEPAPHQHSVPAPAALAPSLLRLSVAQRLAIAAFFSALLWLAVAWALGGGAP